MDLTLGQVQVHAIKSSTCRENPQKNQLYLYILSAFECKRFHSDFGDSKKTVPSTCAARSYCKISVDLQNVCFKKSGGKGLYFQSSVKFLAQTNMCFISQDLCWVLSLVYRKSRNYAQSQSVLWHNQVSRNRFPNQVVRHCLVVHNLE